MTDKWKKELDEAGIPERKFPEIKVEDLGDGYVRLTGGIYGIVHKNVWNVWYDAFMKAANLK